MIGGGEVETGEATVRASSALSVGRVATVVEVLDVEAALLLLGSAFGAAFLGLKGGMTRLSAE